VIPAAPAPPVFVLEPGGARTSVRLRELWEYRELVYFMAWRDVKVRYKQTVLGAAWAVLQPLLTMVVFSVVFGRLAGIPSDGVPYPVFAFAALVPWQLFAYALSQTSSSVVANQALVTRVYFPRLVIPLASILAGLVDYAIALGVLFLLAAWYGVWPGPALLVLPLLTLLVVVTALAVGSWLAVLNARYRDVSYVVPFLVQLWLFATPVAYPASLVPEGWRLLFGLNPMAGVVEAYRWAILGAGAGPGPLLLVSTAVTVVLLALGLAYFSRSEATMADVI
jgi:lipopolysaccharide transport system permease protein